MDRSTNNLIKNKLKISVIIFILMTLTSCFIFPVIPTNSQAYTSYPFLLIGVIILLRMQMIYVCFIVGRLIKKLYPSKSLHVFGAFFFMNLIGFLLRLLLEWGESSLMRDLTLSNIVIHLIVIPGVILFSYLRSNLEG